MHFQKLVSLLAVLALATVSARLFQGLPNLQRDLIQPVVTSIDISNLHVRRPNMLLQIGEFFLKTAGEDWESAPSLGIQVLIV